MSLINRRWSLRWYRQVVEPEAGRKCRLIVVEVSICLRLNELRNKRRRGRLRHASAEEEKRE